MFRQLFEIILRRCINEGLVAGESFGVNASLIPANANQTRGIDSKEGLPPELTSRVMDEHLETLDDAAFGGPNKAVPKYISPVDPAARWTGADGGAAFFAYSTNYMVELDNAMIADVEASVPIRTAEAFTARRLIDRIADRFDMTPDKLVGDTGYGSAVMLGWLVEERGIAQHVPVWDESKRAGRSHLNILSTILRPTATHAPAKRNYGHIAGTFPSRERQMVVTTASSDTALQSMIAMHAR